MLAVLSVGATSCVNEAYDLNHINLKMTLGADGVTLPLGKLETQTVRKLLGDSGVDTLKLDTDDGYYAYRVEDSFTETIESVTVEPVERLLPDFDPAIVHLEVGDVADLPDLPDLPGVGEVTPVLQGDASFAATIDDTFALPDEVVALTYARVYDASSPQGETSVPEIVVRMTFDQMPFETCRFEQIRISLPPFLVSDSESYDEATHSIEVDRVDYVGPSTEIVRIPVVGIRDIPVEEDATGKVGHLTGDVEMTARVWVEGIDGEVREMDLTLQPEVSLPPLGVSQVTGRVDLDLQRYLEPTTIDFDDLSEALDGEKLELNLVAPQIEIRVVNPIGIAMTGAIRLQPYDLAGAPLDPVVVSGVRIAAAEGVEPRTTKLYITDQTEAPSGYELCHVADLSDLVREVPSRIDVSFELDTDPDEEHHIAVSGERYDLDMDYLVRLPLAFRDGATIDYTMTEDVSDSFDEIDKYELVAEDILIRIAARSTLPLTLGLTADFLAADGTPVEDVVAEVTGEIKGHEAGTPDEPGESQLAVSLQIADGNLSHLQQVDRIRLRFQGTAVGAGAALSPEQYLEAKMTLVLQQGITFDLDELLSE